LTLKIAVEGVGVVVEEDADIRIRGTIITTFPADCSFTGEAWLIRGVLFSQFRGLFDALTLVITVERKGVITKSGAPIVGFVAGQAILSRCFALTGLIRGGGSWTH
jgi:hypothetical protein